MGHKRTHAEFVGEREGFTVVALSPLGIWGIALFLKLGLDDYFPAAGI